VCNWRYRVIETMLRENVGEKGNWNNLKFRHFSLKCVLSFSHKDSIFLVISTWISTITVVKILV